MLDIALRNLVRNRRRSIVTAASIAIGSVAVTLFSAFAANVTNGLQTETVVRLGHLNIFRKGYFASGGGNPGAYGIPGYAPLIDKLRSDPLLKPMLTVVTPTVSVGGIVSGTDSDASSTFFAQGVVPADRQTMAQWNAYGLPGAADALTSGVPEGSIDSGIVGAGLARILNLCVPPAPRCGNGAAATQTPPSPPADGTQAQRFADLAKDVAGTGDRAPESTVNLLAATSGGAPNVVTLRVVRQVRLGIKELDDRYVGMPIALAQKLLFGRGERQATAIVVQLKDTANLPRARERIAQLTHDSAAPLEIIDFATLSPAYRQINEFYGTLSNCLMVLICTVALFMTVNTMSASIFERTREIGTLRALGMDRGPLRRLFVAEGLLLGTAGATLGVGLAAALVLALNHAGLTWMPPGSLRPVPMRFSFVGAVPTTVVLWVLLVFSAGLAARFAAGRAARLNVVTALRHA
ncbi:ABC transporter permease [Burkholderia sp. Bp8963]|uniref:ABC transporter permease n=1 Tax=Burkholderia sp. Bp8963 TaxID=2184547 RepID=UPI000F59C1FE|nr:FtsX-like permease family protein [Burkholderia sp. Bp8963]RQS70489.1 ABC transporter permease [Burkholderia sp. Bp8963]